MDIRIATTADRDAVLALLGAQFDDHDIATDRLAPAVDGLLGVARRGQVLLARFDGDAIGIAALLYTWSLEHGGDAAWLDELFVVPAHRNRGVGLALLDAALVLAREHGALAVDLEVAEGHERAARLYERAGFLRHHRTRFVRLLP